MSINIHVSPHLLFHRFKHLDSTSSTSKAPRSAVEFLTHWRSHCTVISDGGQPSKCSSSPRNSGRQVLSICLSCYSILSEYQPIGVFLTSADEMYGPITTLHGESRQVKHIPWTAFKLSDRDWHRVVDARDILEACIPCSLILHQKLIDCLGFQSYSAVLLLGNTTNPMACPSHSWRAAISLGEETQCPQVCSLQRHPHWWSQEAAQVLFSAWWKAQFCVSAW